MSTFLKKTLIYSLVATIALPLWLITGYVTAAKAHAISLTESVYRNAVYISEVSAETSTDWLEIFNASESQISFDDWRVKDEINSPSLPFSGEIPAHGLVVLEGSFNLNASSSDSASLLDENGLLIDVLSYTGDLDGKTFGRTDYNLPTGIVLENESKGWFNSGLTVAQIVSALPAEITTNLGTEEIDDPTVARGLYFEVIKEGRITFNQTLNLTNTETILMLQKLGDLLKIEAGRVKLDARMSEELKDADATITMYDANRATSLANPKILALDDEGNLLDEAGLVTNITVSGNNISFDVAHFTEFIVDGFGPSLYRTNFTSRTADSSPVLLPGNQSDGFQLGVGPDGSNDHFVQFSSSTSATEPLKNEYFGLYLKNLVDVTVSDLESYYTETKAEPYRTELISSLPGKVNQKPFAYIKGNGVDKNISLADGLHHRLLQVDKDMIIPDNYPLGTYKVEGEIEDLAGHRTMIFLTLIVEDESLVPPVKPTLTLSFDKTNKTLLSVSGEGEIGATANYEVALDSVVVLSGSGVVRNNGSYSISDIDISNLADGYYSVEVSLTDVDGNTSESADEFFNLEQVIDENGMIGAGGAGHLIVNVPASNNNAYLDFGGGDIDPETGLVTIHSPILINKETEKGLITIEIPAETKFDSGIIRVPNIVNSVINPVPGDNGVISDVVAMEVGLSDATITFNQPVKITFTGMAGKKTGFVKDGKFVEIKSICENIENPSINSFSETGECKGNLGTDLVVWTKHFTQFVAYTEKTVVAPVFTAMAKEENGVKNILVEWQGNGSTEYKIFVNGILSETVTGSVADNAVKYSKLVKVTNYGSYEITMIAVLSGVSSKKSDIKTVKFVDPQVEKPAIPAPEQDVVTSVAPKKAKAAETVKPEEKKVETPSDDQGVIKGDEDEEDDSINWTPWIVIFILIILAGAVTGGYFYWFVGKEEEDNKKPVAKKVETKKSEPQVIVRNKDKKSKKRRW